MLYNRKREEFDIRKTLAMLAVFVVITIAFNIPHLFESIDNKTMDSIQLIVYLLIYLGMGYEILAGSIKNVFMSFTIDQKILITLSSLGGFLIGHYALGCGIMLLYLFIEAVHREWERNSDKILTKIFKIYTPIVIVVSIAVALIPSVINSVAGGKDISRFDETWMQWINLAILILIIAGICSIAISFVIMAYNRKSDNEH